MDKVIPIVELVLDPNDSKEGVKTISLVDKPAIESNFQYFSKDGKTIKYVALAQTGDSKEYKQVVHGLALIPDKLITRLTDDGQPYYVYFSVSTIDAIRQKFHREQQGSNVNLMHDSKDYINAYMFEDFLVDSEERQADLKKKGIDAPLGSWYVKYKIDDKDAFERVKSGEFRGFSVEALMDSIHKSTIINNKKEDTKMKFIEKLQALIAEESKEEVKLETANGLPTATAQPVKAEDAPAPSASTSGETSQAPAVDASAALKAEIDALKLEVEKLKADKLAAETSALSFQEENKKSVQTLASVLAENKKLNSQVVELKKQPQAAPIVQTTPAAKKEYTQDELSKMTNTQRVAVKMGIDMKG